MGKYSVMTDFEINKAVDEALGIASQIDVSDGIACNTQTDYTGDNSSCMQLMIDFKIGLINLDGTNLWIAFTRARFETICMSPDGSDSGVSTFDCKHEVHHTKPLRAVCECFLRMREL